jgi:hypothetical protein
VISYFRPVQSASCSCLQALSYFFFFCGYMTIKISNFCKIIYQLDRANLCTPFHTDRYKVGNLGNNLPREFLHNCSGVLFQTKQFCGNMNRLL